MVVKKDRTPRGDITDVIPTWHKQVKATTYIGGSMAQRTHIGYMSTTYKTKKGDNRHQNPIEDFEPLKRDNKRHLTDYAGEVKTSKRDNGISWAPERDKGIKTPGGEHKTSHRDCKTAANRDSGGCWALIGDKISMHGIRNKDPTSLTLNGGDNTHMATWKSDSRAVEENSESPEVKFPVLKYANQTSIMRVTIQDSKHSTCTFQLAPKILLYTIQSASSIKRRNQVMCQKLFSPPISCLGYLKKCNRHF